MRPKMTEVTVAGVTTNIAYGCKRPICGTHQILKVNGDCESCPEGQRAIAGGYYCDDYHIGPEGGHGDDHHDDHHRRLNEIFE